MIDDYERPNIENLMGTLLGDLVGEGQIGTNKIETFDRYAEMLDTDSWVEESDFDFILLRRAGGYLTDEMTDIIGLEVQVWAISRDRATEIMEEVTKRILNSEHETIDGFLIDFAVCLRGPEEDPPRMVEDKVLEQGFELHIRVRWK